MKTRILYSLRILGTGMAWGLFGLGGLILTGLVFPILQLLSGDEDTKIKRARVSIHYTFHLFFFFAENLKLMSKSVEGIRKLSQQEEPCILVANHPTLIDIVLILACIPQLTCIVKKDLWDNFFLKGAIKEAGYIPNTGGNDFLETCAEELNKNRSIIIFPEGTRSPRNSLGKFQRGAAHLALRTGCQIIPMVITCSPPTLMKNQKWYRIPESSFHLGLKVDSPFPNIFEEKQNGINQEQESTLKKRATENKEQSKEDQEGVRENQEGVRENQERVRENQEQTRENKEQYIKEPVGKETILARKITTMMKNYFEKKVTHVKS